VCHPDDFLLLRLVAQIGTVEELKKIVARLLGIYGDHLQIPNDYDRIIAHAATWLQKSMSMSVEDFTCWFHANFKRKQGGAGEGEHQQDMLGSPEAMAAAIRRDKAVEQPITMAKQPVPAAVQKKISSAIMKKAGGIREPTPPRQAGGETPPESARAQDTRSTARARLRDRLSQKRDEVQKRDSEDAGQDSGVGVVSVDGPSPGPSPDPSAAANATSAQETQRDSSRRDTTTAKSRLANAIRKKKQKASEAEQDADPPSDPPANAAPAAPAAPASKAKSRLADAIKKKNASAKERSDGT